jgi:hypothetical protein
MLSFRTKTSEDWQRSSLAYIRQSLASLRVSSGTNDEVLHQLVLFPFVPYAVSLSLSVAYRVMRHSKVSIYRARARSDIQSNCVILSKLGDFFWSAATMATMGQLTIKEMDRVAAVVTSSERCRSRQADAAETEANNFCPNQRNTLRVDLGKSKPFSIIYSKQRSS